MSLHIQKAASHLINLIYSCFHESRRLVELNNFGRKATDLSTISQSMFLTNTVPSGTEVFKTVLEIFHSKLL